MPDEISYVILTPNSIRKSKTGSILSRLMSRTGLDLAAVRMFAPSQELAEKYAAAQIDAALKDYVAANFAARSGASKALVMMLVFRGEDAVKKVSECVSEAANGETVRGTFGDTVTDAQGNVVYFEPAALAPTDAASAERDLKLWAEYSDSDGGLLEDAVEYPAGENVEKTLVLIKPDNWKFPNMRPGAVIETFSRSGLNIIAAKIHHMSCAQGEKFYGPVLAVLQDKLRGRAAGVAKEALEPLFNVEFTPEQEAALGEVLGPINGRESWEDIVEFMSGRRPSKTPADLREAPGTAKIMALIYQGPDAVNKIRTILGPTNPASAPTGTIRKEFGVSIMVNGAHASDSADNAKHEMGIVQITENHFRSLVEAAFSTK